MSTLSIGGAPAVTLRAPRRQGQPGVVEAVVLPGRGCMLLQATAALPDGRRVALLDAPTTRDAAARLGGGADNLGGRAATLFGGAILAPWANRLFGEPAGPHQIEAQVGPTRLRLPRDGQAACALHGLILNAAVQLCEQDDGHVRGVLTADGFAGPWLGGLVLDFTWRLEDGGLSLRLRAENRGPEPAPFAAGWHPYIRLPGDRRRAQLRVPAGLRAEVCDDGSLRPTGRLLPTAGTAFDFTDGRPLADIALDDCFTALRARSATLVHPNCGYGVRITAEPPVAAFQVYAPRDAAFVAIEPQFNLADPFGPQWRVDTGVQWLAAGDGVTFAARLEAILA